MRPEIWLSLTGILAASITAGMTWIIARKSGTRMETIEREKQDVAEAERHDALTQHLIDNLRDEIDRLNRVLGDYRSALTAERALTAELQQELRLLTKTCNELRYQILVLRRRLGLDDATGPEPES